MNNTKWKKVLDILVDNNVETKTKLIFHDVDKSKVVIAYSSEGKPFYLRYETIQKPTESYYESGAIGPFKASDIEWIELKKKDFEKYISKMGIKLKTEESCEGVKVYGYKGA